MSDSIRTKTTADREIAPTRNSVSRFRKDELVRPFQNSFGDFLPHL